MTEAAVADIEMKKEIDEPICRQRRRIFSLSLGGYGGGSCGVILFFYLLICKTNQLRSKFSAMHLQG